MNRSPLNSQEMLARLFLPAIVGLLFVANHSRWEPTSAADEEPLELRAQLQERLRISQTRFFHDKQLQTLLSTQENCLVFQEQFASVPRSIRGALLIQQVDVGTGYSEETGFGLRGEGELPRGLVKYYAVLLYLTPDGIGVISQLNPESRIAGLDLLAPIEGFTSVYRSGIGSVESSRRWREQLDALIDDWNNGPDHYRDPIPSNDATRIIAITIADTKAVRQIEGVNLVPSEHLGPRSGEFDRRVLSLLRQLLIEGSPRNEK